MQVIKELHVSFSQEPTKGGIFFQIKGINQERREYGVRKSGRPKQK